MEKVSGSLHKQNCGGDEKVKREDEKFLESGGVHTHWGTRGRTRECGGGDDRRWRGGVG